MNWLPSGWRLPLTVMGVFSIPPCQAGDAARVPGSADFAVVWPATDDLRIILPSVLEPSKKKRAKKNSKSWLYLVEFVK